MAAEGLARAKTRAERLPRRPQVAAYALQPTPATRSYLKIKERSAGLAGCNFIVRDIKMLRRPSDVFDTDEADAIIVQLPLPEGTDTSAVLNSIPIEKDADVLSTVAREQRRLLPPVVGAIDEIFKYSNVEVKNKKAVIVGRGFLVGTPTAAWLEQEDAQVALVSSRDPSLFFLLREADIIVSGAGSPHRIKSDMLKEGVVLIDAGTSESSGKIVGDADPACAEKCSIFTPVPGGVGPLAVAKLFENAVMLAENATK